MQRSDFIEKIKKALEINPCAALLGPRQCGKTTLAKAFAKKHKGPVNYFDLENPVDLARLEQPMLALESLKGLIVIDEIRLRPNLFPILRVLIDTRTEQSLDKAFLILGSASRDLIAQSSETLAGRISYLELTPFNYSETQDVNTLWIRGGFPNSFLATNELHSYQWRQEYIRTFLERDIPNLGIKIPAQTINKFWMMLTHYHGQFFNASEIGTSLGAAHTTIRRYLDILTGTFMIRELSPWIAEIAKRHIKSPKIYFRDSGIFHALLGITEKKVLLTHPKLGASWEGFALEEVIRHHAARPEDCYFWGIHNQCELDLLIVKDNKKLGFEFKYMDAPRLTKSMRHANEILQPDKLIVIYPGKENYRLAENIEVHGLTEYLQT